MKNSILILSGGVDSVTLLYKYKDDIALAILFKYGANHEKKELRFARYHCRKLKINYIEIKIDFYKKFTKSTLLNNEINVDDSIKKQYINTNIAFRNGVMLSIATAIAEEKKLKNVIIGSLKSDVQYDNCKEFIDNFSLATQTGTYNKIKIIAPFKKLEKKDVIKLGTEIGVDYRKTWTCYQNKKYQCGKCNACISRKKAFKEVKIIDPTRYEV